MTGAGSALGMLFGVAVGFSPGLTDDGGSILAASLLVYGLGAEPREAVGFSLAAVGTTALVGGLRRLARGEGEVRVGLIFAAAGMLGAPLGSWIGGRTAGRQGGGLPPRRDRRGIGRRL